MKYKNEFKILSPILIDENASVAKAYGVWVHPLSFFINGEEKIVGRKFGGNDWTSMGTKNLIQHLSTGG